MSAYGAMATLVDALDADGLGAARVIDWAAPVPYFGRLSRARIATVGINPSNKEFVADDGSALSHSRARLPTMASLELDRWGAADHCSIRTMLGACENYFDVNPYGRWFGVLERLLLEADASYFGGDATACHIDVVPFATHAKWGDLPRSAQVRLLNVGLDATGLLLRESRVEVLVLNGRSVAAALKTHVDVLDEARMPAWDLARTGPAVPGVAYTGSTMRLGRWDLGREIQVVGWNHNLQSSFGVTAAVKAQIARWLTAAIGTGL